MIEAGTTVEGYRVVRMIGRGGMGVVYEAVQTSLNRRVALKVLRPELAEDPDFAERFEREARLQASLEHPGVLDVYEVGETSDGLFLSMRLVSGQTLLDLLRDEELDAERTLALLDQVTAALDVAHDANLVHRDIKPQNVLVDEGDRAYLADFGLTRAAAETTVTASRPMLGSVAYVAPEIVRGEEPTPASDRYSLGATVFHCLTGDVVFPRGSDAAVLYAHAAEPPPRVRERRAELPKELDPILDAALAKDPDARPQSAQSIVHSLREALGPTPARFGSPPPTGATGALAGDAVPPPPPRAGGKRLGASPLAWAGVLLAAAILVAVAALALGDGEDEASGETPLPAVPQHAEPLGSDLAVPERALGCDGQPPAANSTSCTIVQAELPGAEVLVPADGAIVGWTVRGASGDVALDVIRPRGGDTTRVGRSQWEFAGNSGPYRFETSLPVEAGDRVGLSLGPGASVGITETAGATTERWLEPVGGAYGNPDEGTGTGFDYELALRAEFVPGEKVELPEHIQGPEAANAPDGKVRDSAKLAVDEPPTELELELVELKDRVVLDVFDEGRRTLRVFIPGLVPGGIPAELKSYEYPGEPTGEADVWWVNPNTGRMIFNFFLVGRGHLEFAG